MTGEIVDRLMKRPVAAAVVTPEEAVDLQIVWSLPPRLRRWLALGLRWTVLVLTSVYATAFFFVLIRFAGHQARPYFCPAFFWGMRTSLAGPAAIWLLGLFACSTREYSGVYGAALGLAMMLVRLSALQSV